MNKLRAAVAASAVLSASACTNRDLEGGEQAEGGQTDTGASDDTSGPETNTGGRDATAATTEDVDSGTTADGEPADSTRGDGESSGSTGPVVEDCRDARSRGPLCGPGPTPCAVVADEVIHATEPLCHFAPVLAINGDCEPRVHYTAVEDAGAVGYLAGPTDDGGWDAEPTPLSRVERLHSDPDSGQLLAVDGDELGVWTWDGRWALQALLAPEATSSARGAAAGVDGRLYLAVRNETDGVSGVNLHTWDPQDPAVFASELVSDGSSASAIGVGGGETASVAWWGTTDGTSQLQIVRADAPPTVLDSTNPLTSMSPSFAGDRTEVATGGDHVLFTTIHLSQEHGQQTHIRYAQRDPSGEWTVSTAYEPDPDGVSCPSHVPPAPGQLCDYDYTEVRALSIVTNDQGDVRVFFVEDHLVGQAVGGTHCRPPGASPVPLPAWWCPEGTVTSQLFVGWPDDDGNIVHQPLEVDHRITRMDVAVDAAGAMNLAALVTEPGAEPESSIRYLRLQ